MAVENGDFSTHDKLIDSIRRVLEVEKGLGNVAMRDRGLGSQLKFKKSLIVGRGSLCLLTGSLFNLLHEFSHERGIVQHLLRRCGVYNPASAGKKYGKREKIHQKIGCVGSLGKLRQPGVGNEREKKRRWEKTSQSCEPALPPRNN